MKTILKLLFPLLIVLVSCGKNFRQSKKILSFNRSVYLAKAFYAGKFDDNHLNIKEHGYFEYYKKLFGITKVNYQNGVYALRDTILLMCTQKQFDSTKVSLVGFIDTTENLIRLVTKGDSYIEHFQVREGDLKKLFQTIKK